jgi:hypothetical protein
MKIKILKAVETDHLEKQTNEFLETVDVVHKAEYKPVVINDNTVVHTILFMYTDKAEE